MSEKKPNKTKFIKNSKEAFDKVRHRSIELFSENMEIKKAYKKISAQKKEIEKQRDRIELNNEKLKYTVKKAKKRTIDLFGKHIDLKKAKKQIEYQKTEIEIINEQIGDSISYAQLIQQAMLPSEKLIKSKFPESFIFFKPRDVVSGDFYWFSEQDNKLFFVTVDCTGHGVPGAFMSMIGNSLLNMIINDNKIYVPSRILKRLNKEVVYALNQDENPDSLTQDGMDITICVIDKVRKEIIISSASQSCFVIVDKQVYSIKGDIFSIGGMFANHPLLNFKDHKIKIGKNTIVYLFSDGYQDQFGGPENTKFMSAQLKKILLKNHNLPMDMQVKEIDKEFRNWKGNKKQIDDVLVVGLKITS
ncbi:MAG: SpoIIE family protein phosphatase [Bacteroidales bacterium]|nr:SpoIIE family protein phosphatase [Bacteroidales bacterium]